MDHMSEYIRMLGYSLASAGAGTDNLFKTKYTDITKVIMTKNINYNIF